MADFKPDVKQTANHCEPTQPPPSTDKEPCTGTITLDCCCPRLYSRTFILQLGPQSEPQLQAFLQNTVNAWENSGYVVLAHSLVDAGAGWMLGLTVGWYA